MSTCPQDGSDSSRTRTLLRDLVLFAKILHSWQCITWKLHYPKLLSSNARLVRLQTGTKYSSYAQGTVQAGKCIKASGRLCGALQGDAIVLVLHDIWRASRSRGQQYREAGLDSDNFWTKLMSTTDRALSAGSPNSCSNLGSPARFGICDRKSAATTSGLRFANAAAKSTAKLKAWVSQHSLRVDGWSNGQI